ncbi:hypothetical protein ABI59_07580 [Acidobacteria bacterium Mor1]|nr:hypothetical protein ABI59_07580 [Acidobacteria bacterium Mor1]
MPTPDAKGTVVQGRLLGPMKVISIFAAFASVGVFGILLGAALWAAGEHTAGLWILAFGFVYTTFPATLLAAPLFWSLVDRPRLQRAFTEWLQEIEAPQQS